VAAPRTENLVFRSFRKDEQAFSLTAREMVGKEQEELRLKGVVLSFGYTVKGAAKTGNISADECRYHQAQQRAVFKGNVRVTTEEGFELFTEGLVWRGDNGAVRTEERVRFRRKDMSGEARGLRYESAEGRLELPAEVVIQLRDPDDPPLDLAAKRAVMNRQGGSLTFEGGVTVSQGGDVLRARSLIADFAQDETLRHLQALDDVVLQSRGGPATRVAQDLSCRKLDVLFRADRTLEEAVAGRAELTLPPPAGPRPERRRLEGRTLAFSFDEHGRLFSVRGQAGTTFTVVPVEGAARVLRSQRFLAQLDPATGATTTARFEHNVEYEQGGRRATAERADYDEAGVFGLRGSPELTDEKEGMRLRAQSIDMGTRNGDLAATRGVRHVTQGRPESGLMQEPAVVSSGQFRYTSATGEAVYRDEAILRSGRTEVRGGEIRLRDEGGKRRLEASGGVRSRLEPEPGAKGGERQPVEGTAQAMTYDEAKRQAVYRGDAVIRQADVVVRGPEATLTFTADGRELEKVEAGSPVEIQQGTRKASGERGTYDPREELLVVVGEKVVLRDEGQVVRGRKLTFKVGDERVVVDGQDESRTETVFRRDPPKP
jgi:lipopolysaccharide export system protein LptA